MKWILLVLLVTNLALGGYQYWIQNQPVEDNQISVELARFNNLELTSSQSTRLESAATSKTIVRAQSNDQCIRITGLIEGDSLPVLESRLKALEVSSTQEKIRNILKQDFQVLMGPFSNNDEARAELADVSAKGIESYVISSGENVNSLSLGVFSSNANAEKKLKEVRAVGIDASIYTKDHYTESVILRIDRQSARMVSDDTLQSMLSTFNGAEFLRYNCN